MRRESLPSIPGSIPRRQVPGQSAPLASTTHQLIAFPGDIVVKVNIGNRLIGASPLPSSLLLLPPSSSPLAPPPGCPGRVRICQFSVGQWNRSDEPIQFVSGFRFIRLTTRGATVAPLRLTAANRQYPIRFIRLANQFPWQWNRGGWGGGGGGMNLIKIQLNRG